MVAQSRWVAFVTLLGVSSTALAAKDLGGRPQALISATAFGLYEGIALSIILSEHDLLPEPTLSTGALLTLATTSGSFVVAWNVTERFGVNRAQASLLNSSLFWTVLNGAMVGVETDFTGEEMLWTTLISGWVGQGAGVLLAANINRTAGEVSLMNSAATWSGAETALILGAVGVEKGSRYFTVGTLVADAALLTSAFLVRRLDISASRGRMLDLGALCGGLAGPAALFMVWGPEEHMRAWYLSAVAIGIPVGIAAAWHLTRDFDTKDATGVEQSTAPASLTVPLLGGMF